MPRRYYKIRRVEDFIDPKNYPGRMFTDDRTLFTSYMATTYYLNLIHSGSVAQIINREHYEVRKAYSHSSSLIKYGLLDERTDIADELTEYISGFSDTPLIQQYYKKYTDAVMPLEDFTVEKEDLELVRTILSNPNNFEGA